MRSTVSGIWNLAAHKCAAAIQERLRFRSLSIPPMRWLIEVVLGRQIDPAHVARLARQCLATTKNVLGADIDVLDRIPDQAEVGLQQVAIDPETATVESRSEERRVGKERRDRGEPGERKEE